MHPLLSQGISLQAHKSLESSLCALLLYPCRPWHSASDSSWPKRCECLLAGPFSAAVESGKARNINQVLFLLLITQAVLPASSLPSRACGAAPVEGKHLSEKKKEKKEEVHCQLRTLKMLFKVFSCPKVQLIWSSAA